MIKFYAKILIIFCFVQYLNGQTITSINSDKARYEPGDTVHFYLEFSDQVTDAILEIRYFHLGNVVAEDQIEASGVDKVSWIFVTPEKDFTGYLAEVKVLSGNAISSRDNIAFDVSSEWTRFPRYGFLSDYTILNSGLRDNVLSNLNRYHINGLQYYDWQYKHHMPLKGTASEPAYSWKNIFGRTVYYWTVKYYIAEAAAYNISSMNYNLLYGAYSDAANDGASDEWRIYNDPNHQEPRFHDLPDSWESDIYLMDPYNQNWRDYIFAQEAVAFEALEFEGWHIDQLGDPGTVYNYSGSQLDIKNSYSTFVSEAKNALGKKMVMNAVGQYGQSEIAKATVEFLYTEHWDDDSYSDLAEIIRTNNQYSQNKLNTVLAAYMNYDHGQNIGNFNTPGILYTDAVIFSEGGAHLELGEHMLHNEFFPANNLEMEPILKSRLVDYYDFLTAYQNILRDSISTGFLTITSDLNLSNFVKTESVWKRVKNDGERDIIHLVNFYGATHTRWKDKDANQTPPAIRKNFNLQIHSSESIGRIWFASPDTVSGSPISLTFSEENGIYTVTIPYLEYWSMIVIEYGETVNLGNIYNPEKKFFLGNNYPNPFNPVTKIDFEIAEGGNFKLGVRNLLGEDVKTLREGFIPGGSYSEYFDAGQLPSGVYFYYLNGEGKNEVKKMLLLK